jgi:hypothetical protein
VDTFSPFYYKFLPHEILKLRWAAETLMAQNDRDEIRFLLPNIQTDCVETVCMIQKYQASSEASMFSSLLRFESFSALVRDHIAQVLLKSPVRIVLLLSLSLVKPLEIILVHPITTLQFVRIHRHIDIARFLALTSLVLGTEHR